MRIEEEKIEEQFVHVNPAEQLRRFSLTLRPIDSAAVRTRQLPVPVQEAQSAERLQ